MSLLLHHDIFKIPTFHLVHQLFQFGPSETAGSCRPVWKIFLPIKKEDVGWIGAEEDWSGRTWRSFMEVHPTQIMVGLFSCFYCRNSKQSWKENFLICVVSQWGSEQENKLSVQVKGQRGEDRVLHFHSTTDVQRKQCLLFLIWNLVSSCSGVFVAPEGRCGHLVSTEAEGCRVTFILLLKTRHNYKQQHYNCQWHD